VPVLTARRSSLGRWLLLLAAVVAAGCNRAPDGQNAAPVELNLAIAASTAHVVEPLAVDYQRAIGVVVRCNAAASSTLAHQIKRGAPADVYLSADEQWMDYLAKAGLIQDDSRADLLGNRMVLVAPAEDEAASPAPRDVTEALKDWNGRLAMGDPDHVPAGRYGKAALRSLGLWDAVADKVVPAKDVRAALLLVERGEVDYGIVYATDAASSEPAVVVAEFPEDTHPPVRYPLALTASAKPEARDLLDFLRGDASQRAFESAGFTFLGGPDDGR